MEIDTYTVRIDESIKDWATNILGSNRRTYVFIVPTGCGWPLPIK